MKKLILIALLISQHVFAQQQIDIGEVQRAINTKKALEARQEYLDLHPNDPDRSGDHKGFPVCIDKNNKVFISKTKKCP